MGVGGFGCKTSIGNGEDGHTSELISKVQGKIWPLKDCSRDGGLLG